MIKKLNKSTYLKDLTILLAIPIGVIAFVSSVVYIPKLIANPEYDFVYSVCDNYMCSNDYAVSDLGYISEIKNDSQDSDLKPAYVRYFNTKNGSYSSISIQDFNNYHLINSSKSPDGYNLDNQNSINGALVFRNSDNQWYLKNGLLNKKVELTNDAYYYYGNVKFLGWVDKK